MEEPQCATLPAGAKPGASEVRTLETGGSRREYRLRLPAGYVAHERYPIVLNFHGLGGSGLQQEIASGFGPIADRDGFILVSPDGTGSPRGWAIAGTGPEADVDLTFVKDLIRTLHQELCTNPFRVYATGFSNGAFFSSLLGCVYSDRIHAIAPVGGVNFPEGAECRKPMRILAIHGTADRVVPYEPGLVLGSLPYAGVEANMAAWAKQNRCTGEPFEEDASPGVTVTDIAGCDAVTRTIAVAGWPHLWPVKSGRSGFDASEAIWSFFNRAR
jgi:polyhydroxybutyrate depolymerase